MTISPEILNAYIGGELSEDETQRVRVQIAEDPELIAYVQDQRAVKKAMESPLVVEARKLIAAVGAGRSWVPTAAMVAGIALGAALAGSYGIGTDMRSQAGTLIAQGPLAHVLSTALLAEQDEGPYEGPKIVESFWSKRDAFCRSFMTDRAAREVLSGIACREANAWRIAILATSTPASPEGEPQMPETVKTVRGDLIVGDPLDAEAERQARFQGWRPR